MKIKRLLSLSAVVAVSMFSIHTSAASIDAAAARIAAGEFLKQHATTHSFKAAGTNDIRLAHAQASSQGGNAYYVFNIAGGGWVIIAGDDRANQVLAYNNEGSLDMNNMPENMKGYMDRYQRQIEAVQKYNVPIKASKSPKSVQAAGPLLKNVEWAQQSPFNYQCPTYNGERSSVGCAGLAMAQIVNYWKYPTEMPALESYQNSYYYTYVPSLPARTMDYSLIRNQYTQWTDGSLGWVDGVTDDEKQEVAWLCRYCSQACLMNFSPNGSGSNVLKQKNAFLTMGYSTNAKLLGIEAWPSRETWNSTDYTDDEWTAIMNQELQAGRPLPYSCEGGYSDGHAFVVDGVDAEGLYHVVWGWYGRGDGWFQHRAFDVTVQNQSMHFNDALFMVIDLYPYEGYVIPGSEGKPGDANGDGSVDVTDVALAIKCALGQDAPGIIFENADIDGNGVIEIDDITAIINIVLGK